MNPTVIERITNPKPTYRNSYLSFNMHSRQYQVELPRRAQHELLCEKPTLSLNAIEYERHGGVDYEIEHARCCLRSDLPLTVDREVVNYNYASGPQAITCLPGWRRSNDKLTEMGLCSSVGSNSHFGLTPEQLNCSVRLTCSKPQLESLNLVPLEDQGSKDLWDIGDMLITRCKQGYEIEGADGYRVLTCTESLGWLPDPLNLEPCVFAGRPDWRYHADTDYCYSYFGSKEPADVAEKQCDVRFNSSQLVSIRSASEMRFVQKLIKKSQNTGRFWTSGTRVDAGGFIWADGTPISDLKSSQPNANCVSINLEGIFAEDCLVPMEFICSSNRIKREGAWTAWSDWSACEVSKKRSRTRTCSDPPPFCTSENLGCPGAATENGVCCGDPGFGENAKRNGTGATGAGAILYYTCIEGFQLPNGGMKSDITCELNGLWTDEPAKCIRVSCPVAVNGTSSSYSSLARDGQFLYEDVVIYTCELGFVIRDTQTSTHKTIRCESEGNWSESLPVDCIRGKCNEPGLGENCQPPIRLENGSSVEASDFFYFGDTLIYNCLDGFEFGYTRFLKTVCGPLGTWSHPPPKCHKSLCEQPPAIVQGKLIDELPVYSGDIVTIECEVGYVLNQTTHEILQTTKCISAHVFYPDPVQPCERIYCGEPVNGTNVARRSGNGYFYKDTMMYLCPEGHLEWTLQTQTVTSVCSADGTWQPTNIRCEKADCGDPGPGFNAFRNVTSGFKYGGVVIYTCYPMYGFETDESENTKVLLCNSDGYWNGTTNPRCTNLPIYYALDIKIVNNYIVTLELIQTKEFDGVHVIYTAVFQGSNFIYDETFNKTVQFNHTHFGEYRQDIFLQPGFSYTLWLLANSSHSIEYPKPNGDASFVLITGRPSLHQYIWWNLSMPAVEVTGYNQISAKIGQVFSDVNGTIRGYTLIVCETLPWIDPTYYSRRNSEQLPSYAQIKSDDQSVWPCYQVFDPCEIFSVNNSCGFLPTTAGYSLSSSSASYVVGAGSCQKRNPSEYCNGPLKPSARFCVKVRAYTEDDYTDTACSESLLMDPDYNWREDLVLPFNLSILPFIMLIFITLFLLYLKCRKPNIERMESKDSFLDLMNPGKSKTEEVVLKGRAGAAVNTWHFHSPQAIESEHNPDHTDGNMSRVTASRRKMISSFHATEFAIKGMNMTTEHNNQTDVRKGKTPLLQVPKDKRKSKSLDGVKKRRKGSIKTTLKKAIQRDKTSQHTSLSLDQLKPTSLSSSAADNKIIHIAVQPPTRHASVQSTELKSSTRQASRNSKRIEMPTRLSTSNSKQLEFPTRRSSFIRKDKTSLTKNRRDAEPSSMRRGSFNSTEIEVNQKLLSPNIERELPNRQSSVNGTNITSETRGASIHSRQSYPSSRRGTSLNSKDLVAPIVISSSNSKQLHPPNRHFSVGSKDLESSTRNTSVHSREFDSFSTKHASLSNREADFPMKFSSSNSKQLELPTRRSSVNSKHVNSVDAKSSIHTRELERLTSHFFSNKSRQALQDSNNQRAASYPKENSLHIPRATASKRGNSLPAHDDTTESRNSISVPTKPVEILETTPRGSVSVTQRKKPIVKAKMQLLAE